MNLKKFMFIAVCAAMFCCSAVWADSISYDASLSGPGWYNGAGNPNGGFTIVNANGYEVGLRVKGRQNPNVINTPTNIYSVPLGSQPGNPARAWWNYEWSISGVPGVPLTNVFPYSTFTVQDLTQGVSETVNFPYWGDNSTFGPSGKQDAGPSNGFGVSLYPVNWGAQNSENPTFADFPLALAPGYTFNMNAADYYRFTVDVKDGSGALLASDSIDVSVGGATLSTPEPASLTLLGAGLLGLFFAKRRKQ